MQDRIFSLLVEENEISWKSIIFDLIKTNQMNPWDVDISLLSKKYVEYLHKLQEQDLKVSGKVLLAAAMLLRIKSTRLLEDDLTEFDRLIASEDPNEESFYDELERDLAKGEQLALEQDYQLHPRLPQARRRKVSVYDLVKALEKALEVKQRRILDYAPPSVNMPVRQFDVGAAIASLLDLIANYGGDDLTFHKLLKSNTKKEKIFTFIPLLHLANQHKVDLIQDTPFGDISIKLLEGE